MVMAAAIGLASDILANELHVYRTVASSGNLEFGRRDASNDETSMDASDVNQLVSNLGNRGFLDDVTVFRHAVINARLWGTKGGND